MFLGRDNDWQKDVRIITQAVEGLRLLNTIAGAGIYMITNQAGVAISDFPLLTEELLNRSIMPVASKPSVVSSIHE